MGYLCDIEGIEVGHYTDAVNRTGCTAILCRQGAVVGADVRGSAPGTREIALTRTGNTVKKAHAIVLSGGSAYGLAAADGVIEYLEECGVGVKADSAIVPIVCSAVLYDLGVGSPKVRPGKREGRLAAEAASSKENARGRVGAGTGATIGKVLGKKYAMDSGLGSATVNLGNGVKVSALFAVNAFGDVYDDNNNIIAGTRVDGKFVNSLKKLIESGAEPTVTNTTIGVVATNASLDKEQANKMAQCAHDGLAIAIRPVHTMEDGDTVFALSAGEREADFNSVLAAAVEATRLAIIDAVKG